MCPQYEYIVFALIIVNQRAAVSSKLPHVHTEYYLLFKESRNFDISCRKQEPEAFRKASVV